MRKHLIKIKNILEKLYSKYNHRGFIKPDPLQFVYRYAEPSDMEVTAFLAADLAYGQVEQIRKSLDNLLERIGDSPYAFVSGFGEAERQRLRGFKHRFTTGEDISDLLALLKKILRRYGSIWKFFIRGYNTGDRNIIPALSRFCDSLSLMYTREHGRQLGRGLRYLLASPARGSACKRLNLFLRWMVRNDDVDTGLWKSIDKSKLIVPVDVHMSRLCKILGLYNRKTVSLSTAVKITERFSEIEPNDPVKYDFALSRIGILENCNGKYRPACEDCELFEFCRRGTRE